MFEIDNEAYQVSYLIEIIIKRLVKSSPYGSCVTEKRYESLRWGSKKVFNLHEQLHSMRWIWWSFLSMYYHFFRLRNWKHNRFNFTHVSEIQNKRIIICSFLHVPIKYYDILSSMIRSTKTVPLRILCNCCWIRYERNLRDIFQVSKIWRL